MDSSALGRRTTLACAFIAFSLVFAVASSVVGEEGDDRFGGVGLQVVPTAGGELVVLQVIEGSPAAAEGLRPGDFIFQVDERKLAGSDFAEVVSRYLWGRAGTTVTLHYLRPGRAGERSVTLRRVELPADLEPPPGVRLLTPEVQR